MTKVRATVAGVTGAVCSLVTIAGAMLAGCGAYGAVTMTGPAEGNAVAMMLGVAVLVCGASGAICAFDRLAMIREGF